MKTIKWLIYTCILFIILFNLKFQCNAQNTDLNDAIDLTEEGMDITFRTNTGDDEFDYIRWFKFTPEEMNFYTFIIDNPIV
ncbi:MAG: hypothetical protein K5865_07655, partial [Eubacterium sp.]|nr:hypothetical protein [Eubacterium sp.]